MTVDVRSLRALVAVVDEGTFTDAAIALRTSQASVSRAVAALEDTVGVRLLQRSSQGVLPTVQGRRVLDLARRVLSDVALIEVVARDSSDDLRVGFAWAAFGRHTISIHRSWKAENPEVRLTLVQAGTPTAGLLEGVADVAVLRRPLEDRRFTTSLVGVEQRYAALADGDPLLRRRALRLADLADSNVAIDHATGTTTTELWPHGARPSVSVVHGMEEWLTTIASGIAVGITSEATRAQFPRPGVRYRLLHDAPPIPVWLAWWADDPPPHAGAFRQLVCRQYDPPGVGA